ncbi:class I SAM-dependent methyltransferase [Actomonas aquatica]|uniref:Class I SAM-dependent methyltransferase n=1 Tax=Actomonas aquatica TaxID=2866162 RepID=A0ABZ1C5D6_9BACT|nr:class I SAM-dependent methyltransferase [Opitutus sp. WL0086]WRQ86952.1 class I SAM-dependent methyltransferase [Opitutus sp. WL0086]
MQRPDYRSTYQAHFERMIAEHGYERALELVVGDRFAEIGQLEKSALIQLGLRPEHCLVDVGTGSGRLPRSLVDYLTGTFIGTDVITGPLREAEKACARRDWEFHVTTDCVIPTPDQHADFVSFFSVFTHLLDEDIYRFLREARRVLKPDGRVVFSFLDFANARHWELFEITVADTRLDRVLNRITSPEILRRFAHNLGFVVTAVHDGMENWIQLPPAPAGASPDNPRQPPAALGQSVMVLQTFPEASYLDRHPDVRIAIDAGTFTSGAHHYEQCGYREGRPLG